ncbi:MAG: hypothetical protein H7Y30_12740 [Pyrinomonadaceae bacterium]|nr:hypothetical protein [Pyrinomonadaceae bacterium]
MKRFVTCALALGMLSLLFLPFVQPVAAQQPAKQQPVAATTAAKPDASKPVDVNAIIRAFTAKETEFRRALNNYNFKREAVLQSIGMGGQITGEYHRVSNFTFDDSGTRYEKIVFFPMPSMSSVTAEDLEDLGGVNQFALEASKIHLYNFTYVGKEKIDEVDLYVFDVAPKITPDMKKSKERFFLGRVWIDDQELQIVKTRGKGVPEDKNNKYPNFETYRQQIDGRWWFPVYAYTDEELIFDSGQALHVRGRVRYTDYARGRSDVRIIEGDIEDDSEPTPPVTKPKPSPTPSKP